MNASTVELQSAARITNTNTSPSGGQTGAIRIEAREVVTLSGGIIGAPGFGSGTTGHIEIVAPVLALGNRAIISTQNSSLSPGGNISLQVSNLNVIGASFIDSGTVGNGQGGNIVVTSDSVSLSGQGSGLFSNSHPGASGKGGDIQVRARQVQLSDRATITAQGSGTGDAGSILITASDSFISNNSSVTTATTQSDGGNITLQVGRLVQLTDSQITTSVQGGLGNGGNITIDPQFVILSGSQILANAFGGNGGNIFITAGVFLVDPTSTISASSTFGVSGTVNVQTTVTNLSESVAPLSGEFVHTPELLQARCAARFQGGQYSSFVVAGRDGLPLEPGGLLPSPLFVARPGSPKLAKALDVPGLRVGRALEEASLVLAPLELGCAS